VKRARRCNTEQPGLSCLVRALRSVCRAGLGRTRAHAQGARHAIRRARLMGPPAPRGPAWPALRARRARRRGQAPPGAAAASPALPAPAGSASLAAARQAAASRQRPRTAQGRAPASAALVTTPAASTNSGGGASPPAPYGSRALGRSGRPAAPCAVRGRARPGRCMSACRRRTKGEGTNEATSGVCDTSARRRHSGGGRSCSRASRRARPGPPPASRGGSVRSACSSIRLSVSSGGGACLPRPGAASARLGRAARRPRARDPGSARAGKGGRPRRAPALVHVEVRRQQQLPRGDLHTQVPAPGRQPACSVGVCSSGGRCAMSAPGRAHLYVRGQLWHRVSRHGHDRVEHSLEDGRRLVV